MKIRSEFQKPLQNDLRSVFVIEKSCNVIELASELSKPCEGTFIYENETYYGCTKIGDSNGRAWCSTKIDPLTYEHVSGGNFYGFCPENGSCSTAEEGQKIQDRAIDLESCKIISFIVFGLPCFPEDLPGLPDPFPDSLFQTILPNPI